MRILIVDDHPIVASGCRAVLADEGEIALLEAADAESGERVFAVVLLRDKFMPTAYGGRQRPHFEIVKFVTFGDDGTTIKSSVLTASDAPSLAGPATSGGMKTVETPSAKETVKDSIPY